MCAKKVAAGVRFSTLLHNIRHQDNRQITSAQHFDQLEGLAVARPWEFESPLPHQPFDSVRYGEILSERHALGPGDIVHIPAGIPHSFLVPQGKHLTYVLLKIPGTAGQ